MAENACFVIRYEDSDAHGAFAKAVGLFSAIPITFSGKCFQLVRLEAGCVSGLLRDWVDDEHAWDPSASGNADIEILDEGGHVIGRYFFELAMPVYSIGADGRDGATTELGVVGRIHPRPPCEALAIWAQWRRQLPERRNQWAELDFHQRRGWLEVVSNHHSASSTGPRVASESQSQFELDGSFMTDYPGAFLALGEAINGPGGYFGKNLDALDDCLTGGFGADVPFQLNWRDHRVARSHLDRGSWRRDAMASARSVEDFGQWHEEGRSLFEAILDVLKNRGVKVVLS